MNALHDRTARLTQPGIIAIIRAPNDQVVSAAAEALVAGGVVAIEITLTTPNAFEAIRQVSRLLGPRAIVGVGTVLDVAQAREAITAGAEFVVSPILRPALVEVAHAASRPIMLGAYSPTEAQHVHEAGADFVKLFPADGLGPAYIKAIRAPLPHLRIVPTGGVDLTTAAHFIRAGCPALGAGSSLVSAEILRTGNWTELTRLSRAFVDVVTQARSR
jgi:2-dehydro-3-deoxyphosphogluconate aldolase / (4S)-4-hydroxy-2-oxoglutarate aldolase